jgi:hypothetical protein
MEELWEKLKLGKGSRPAFETRYGLFEAQMCILLDTKQQKDILYKRAKSMSGPRERSSGMYRWSEYKLEDAIELHRKDWNKLIEKFRSITLTIVSELTFRGFSVSQMVIVAFVMKLRVVYGRLPEDIIEMLSKTSVVHHRTDCTWSEAFHKLVSPLTSIVSGCASDIRPIMLAAMPNVINIVSQNTFEPVLELVEMWYDTGSADAACVAIAEWRVQQEAHEDEQDKMYLEYGGMRLESESDALKELATIESGDMRVPMGLTMQAQLTMRVLTSHVNDNMMHYHSCASFSNLELVDVLDLSSSNGFFEIMQVPQSIVNNGYWLSCACVVKCGTQDPMQTFLELPILFFLFGKSGSERDRLFSMLEDVFVRKYILGDADI